jgi:hypothetical protein
MRNHTITDSSGNPYSIFSKEGKRLLKEMVKLSLQGNGKHGIDNKLSKHGIKNELINKVAQSMINNPDEFIKWKKETGAKVHDKFRELLKSLTNLGIKDNKNGKLIDNLILNVFYNYLKITNQLQQVQKGGSGSDALARPVDIDLVGSDEDLVERDERSNGYGLSLILKLAWFVLFVTMNITIFVSATELSNVKLDIIPEIYDSMRKVIENDKLNDLFHEVDAVMEKYPKGIPELPIPPKGIPIHPIPHDEYIGFTTTTQTEHLPGFAYGIVVYDPINEAEEAAAEGEAEEAEEEETQGTITIFGTTYDLSMESRPDMTLGEISKAIYHQDPSHIIGLISDAFFLLEPVYDKISQDTKNKLLDLPNKISIGAHDFLMDNKHLDTTVGRSAALYALLSPTTTGTLAVREAQIQLVITLRDIRKETRRLIEDLQDAVKDVITKETNKLTFAILARISYIWNLLYINLTVFIVPFVVKAWNKIKGPKQNLRLQDKSPEQLEGEGYPRIQDELEDEGQGLLEDRGSVIEDDETNDPNFTLENATTESSHSSDSN